MDALLDELARKSSRLQDNVHANALQATAAAKAWVDERVRRAAELAGRVQETRAALLRADSRAGGGAQAESRAGGQAAEEEATAGDSAEEEEDGDPRLAPPSRGPSRAAPSRAAPSRAAALTEEEEEEARPARRPASRAPSRATPPPRPPSAPRPVSAAGARTSVELPEVIVRDGRLYLEGERVESPFQQVMSRAPPPSPLLTRAAQSSNGMDVFDVVIHHLLSLDSARRARARGLALTPVQ